MMVLQEFYVKLINFSQKNLVVNKKAVPLHSLNETRLYYGTNFLVMAG